MKKCRGEAKWSKKREEYNMRLKKIKNSEKIGTELKKNNHHNNIHNK